MAPVLLHFFRHEKKILNPIHKYNECHSKNPRKRKKLCKELRMTSNASVHLVFSAYRTAKYHLSFFTNTEFFILFIYTK